MVVTRIDCVLPLAVDEAVEIVASTMAATAGKQRRRADDPFILIFQQSLPYAKYIQTMIAIAALYSTISFICHSHG